MDKVRDDIPELYDSIIQKEINIVSTESSGGFFDFLNKDKAEQVKTLQNLLLAANTTHAKYTAYIDLIKLLGREPIDASKYNSAVRKYKKLTNEFPTSLIAQVVGFDKEAELVEEFK